MKIIKNKVKLQKEISNVKNLSFIPTMGGFHKGHVSLIKKSKRIYGKSLVSIFVNPKQFNEKKDYNNYPRNLKKDLFILKKLKVDIVYLPNKKEIFSFKVKNKVFLHNFSKKLCGISRKGHFEGVLNVVNRFLEIINPKYLLLGEKDFQQMFLIKNHIKKRKIKTKVISCKLIRETNGVAASTRNKNLSKKQMKIASNVYNFLKIKKKSHDILSKNFQKKLLRIGISKIDYLELLNLKSLKKIKSTNEKYKIFIAYYLGNVRLIDNI